MAKMRIPGVAILAVIVALAVAGCEAVQGDRDVDTSPPGDGVGKSPGLLTGKKGVLVIETEPWHGPSPYGDSQE
ncbi:MAG: hypothetical protein OEU46_22720 [Alphaproteobacteria bacterium]|nr:hypothetical protein [Alphaproteobacteria bacterium]